jgi:hypothetical protein
MDNIPLLDVPAWVAYSVVLIGGLITAWDNVGRLLADHPGYWRYPRTWLLYVLYTLIPIALFWFLDFVDVTEDTSFFAALLVGFAYQQIMTGGINAIAVPGAPAKVWQPFQAYAAKLADRIGDQQISHAQAVADRLATLLADDIKFDRVLALAAERTSNPVQLTTDLDAIDQNQPAVNQFVDQLVVPGIIRRRKIDRILRELRKELPESWERLLLERGVVTKWQYASWLQHQKARYTAAAFIGVLIFSAIAALMLFLSHPSQDRYHAWRLMKRGTTSWD